MLVRRPSRTPIGLGWSAPEFTNINFHFAFLASSEFLFEKSTFYSLQFFLLFVLIIINKQGGLWQLLRLLTVLTLERRHTHMRERCVDRCT
jgi:hypothetical protein